MNFSSFINKYFNKVSVVCISLAILSGVILIVGKVFHSFSDFFNIYISSAVRLILSKITGILPFSLGEFMVLILPFVGVLLIVIFVRFYGNDDVRSIRYLTTMIGVISLMFTMFVFTFATGYSMTDLSGRLDLDVRDVSPEELKDTATKLAAEIERCIDDIDYNYDGTSAMPYSYAELNDKLNIAYDSFCDDHKFVQKMHSRVKLLAVSPVMTYTHISGVFTYYTAEANVNFNYPDYTAPYTMAHEMAHQRGIAPEDEANFIAFLVCMESDDPYIRYSGCMSVLEYVLSAYSKADSKGYSEYVSTLNTSIRSEMMGFSTFFDRYRDSTASKVTDKVNDTYLKASGESAGAKSYGMVVDLACAYFRN